MLYYLVATLFPIDKIIGKIYPIFGAILLLSAIGVFVGIFIQGYQLDNIDLATVSKEFLMYIQFLMHKEIQEWEQNSSLSFS